MLNGRQKAMTAALMGEREYNAERMTGTTSAATPVEASKLLMYIAEQVRDGLLAVRDMRMETFQDPRSINTFDTPYARQVLVQGNQFATIMLEIAPSGRVPDRETYLNIDGSVLDPEVVRQAVNDRVMQADFDIDRDLDAALNTSDEVPDGVPMVKAKRPKTPKPVKDTTPTGASAARDIIFDDPEDDPT